MARDAHNEICTQGGDMLAYLYNEMTEAQRDTFEVHLEDCMTCIDGFAELSQSRYSVYEWKKLDFDPLETPQIIIPYEEARVSFFDQVRAAFGRFGWAAAVPAFGALLIATIVGVAWLSADGDEGYVADNIPAPSGTPLPSVKPPVPLPSQAPITAAAMPPSSQPKKQVEEKIVPVKASDRKPAQRTPAPKPGKTAPSVRRNVPTLADHDDDEDDTLRLSDLFDEIDTSR